MIENNTTQKAEGLGDGKNQTAQSLNVQNGSVPQFQNETQQQVTGRKTFPDWRQPERTAAIKAWLERQTIKEWQNWQRLGKRAIAEGLFSPSRGSTDAGNILSRVWRLHIKQEPPRVDMPLPKQPEETMPAPPRPLRMGIGNWTLTEPLPAIPHFESEQQFLLGLKAYLRAGRESSLPGLAEVAREWERIFNFRMLMTEQYRRRRAASRAKRLLKLQVSVNSSTPQPVSPGQAENVATASPSSLRIRVGVSPSPD